MNVVCAGGGPAGLFFAICAKRLDGNHNIRVVERDPHGATYGWGVTYPDRMLSALYAHDPETASEVRAHSVTWHEQEWQLHGKSAYVLHSRSSLERAALLDILARRAVELGVEVEFGREAGDLASLADADLIVASDGVGSAVRRQLGEHFGTTTTVGRNRYIWLGTDHVFPGITFAFQRTAAGWIWMHAYPSSRRSSTCVVECSPETWQGLHLDTLPSDDGLRLLEGIFERNLHGGQLLDQTRGEPARWLRFQHLTNQTWWHENVVLMGDAAHSAHFTLAAGTRQALKDAASLATCLREKPDLTAALQEYDRRGRETMNRGVESGRRRAEKWENLDPLLEHDALDFIHAKSGRSEAELRRRRPLRRVQQLRAVRASRRAAAVARRWYRTERHWPTGDGRPAAPAPRRGPASSQP
jgi:anthraniloyl-CoA monooxygenase